MIAHFFVPVVLVVDRVTFSLELFGMILTSFLLMVTCVSCYPGSEHSSDWAAIPAEVVKVIGKVGEVEPSFSKTSDVEPPARFSKSLI